LLDLVRAHDDFLFLFLLGGSAFSSLLILLFDERPIFFFTLFFILDAFHHCSCSTRLFSHASLS
jgi:hypothetical protein